MFNQEQLQALLSFAGNGADILSLYLNTDLTQESKDAVRLRVRSLLKEVGPEFKDDVEAIERYLAYEFDWMKPGLVIFSCAPKAFFDAYPTNVAFRNRVRMGKKPYVKPLTHFLDFYAHYGVIMVDRVGARIFEFHLGELLDSSGIMGEEVRKLKRGGGSASTGMRGGMGGAEREEEAVQRNLRQAAAEAQKFFANKDIRRLFLAGTAETVSLFRDLLPKQLQSCIAGTFALDMDAGEHEVRARALTLLQEANAEREDKMVADMITTAAKGGNAILGLSGTLQAASAGRVQTLIISDGYRTPGYRGLHTGMMLSFNGHEPELAGEEFVEVEDIVEEAIARTLEQGGHVEVISGNEDLEMMGRIGALLRY